MAKHKPQIASNTTVSGHDVHAALKAIWDMTTTIDVRLEMFTNVIGGINIVCTVEYERGGETWEVVSEDAWSAYSATLQAHIYRCILNAYAEVDRSLSGIVSMNAKKMSSFPPVEDLPPSVNPVKAVR